MLPAIGSVGALADRGRFGVVVSAQPVGEARDGRQLMALKVKEAGQVQGESALSAQSPSARSNGTSTDGASSNAVSRSTASPAPASAAAARLPAELSAAERADVTRLQQRDQQVRQEEKAHAAVAGDLAGPINYIYQRGPDGRQYAVGGSVGIQATNLSGDPAEAKRIGARMAAAANAATNPSAQDYAVARKAYAFGGQLADPSAEQARSGGLDLNI